MLIEKNLITTLLISFIIDLYSSTPVACAQVCFIPDWLFEACGVLPTYINLITPGLFYS
jgi:hypothetical protein